MISASTAIIGSLLLIPTVPLVLYCIGLLLPSEHVATRIMKYNTTPEIIWAILTSVRDYPAWRSNIRDVTIRSDEFESDLNKYEDDNRLTFVEYTTKDRRTVVIHIEQEYEKKLLRVLEERPYIAPGEELQTNNATFNGSWTFTIEPVEEKVVSLKITEQGVIKKPMMRALYRFFFGYHRGIDRFMKDLGKEIDLGILDAVLEEEKEAEQQELLEKQPSIILEEEEEEDYEAGPDDSMIQPTIGMTESKMIEKEWDMMND